MEQGYCIDMNIDGIKIHCHKKTAIIAIVLMSQSAHYNENWYKFH